MIVPADHYLELQQDSRDLRRQGDSAGPGNAPAHSGSGRGTLMATNWLENDALFRHHLEHGHRMAELVAGAIREHGIAVQVTPLRWREHVSERGAFADEHDLTVGTRCPCRVDVKSQSRAFTSPADWPFPRAFVDTVAGWDAKTHKPSAVVLVSDVTGAALVVPGSSRELWERHTAYDSVRGFTETFYALPPSHLRSFVQFVDWLRQRES